MEAETSVPRLTALEAASALQRLAKYEESLTPRAVGISWLVFALAAPAILFTYDSVIGQLVDLGLIGREASIWVIGLLAALWTPWFWVASLVSRLVFRSLSVRFDVSLREWLLKGSLLAVANLALIAVGGLMAYGLGLPFDLSTFLTMFFGLGAISVGIMQRFWSRVPSTSAIVVGAVLVAGSFGLALLPFGDTSMRLWVAAPLVMACYFAIGARLIANG